jgi:hypothetical protein
MTEQSSRTRRIAAAVEARAAAVPERVGSMSQARLNLLFILGSVLVAGFPFVAAVAVSPLAPEPSTAPPAGGAEISQVVLATAGAMVVTGVLLALVVGHRTERFWLLEWGARISQRVSGLPGWAALPLAIAAPSLLVAVVGMYWDISLHIDVGRDPGPLANPAHYFILIGLFGIFTAGFLAMTLPRSKPGPTAVRTSGDWYAPLGGLLMCASAAFSLVGFPLDDVWHRLFGQDVTLWGPTHLMLLGGAAMTLVGMAVLLTEGVRARPAGVTEGAHSLVMRVRMIALGGALLIGVSIFQAEFDFGVPQFRLVFAPMMTAAAAGIALVAVRIWLGRGAAIAAVGFFILVRGALAVLVGPILGEVTPHFPLYIAEGLIVELVALRIPRDRPLALGIWSGLGIGTVGVAAEWGWSHLWMPVPWPAALFPEGAILGLGMALAGALMGAWMGARLASPAIPRTRPLRIAGVVGAVAIAAMIALALQKDAPSGVSAQVDLTTVRGGADPEAAATVRITPPDAAQDAEWLNVTAWQGGGFELADLDRVGPGVYRTSQPIPVGGSWKTIIRLQKGDSLGAVPIYLPEDEAIPAPEVPARDHLTRAFVADHDILQREQKSTAAALPAIANGIVLAIALALLTMLAWGLHRLARAAEPDQPAGREVQSREPRRVGGPAPAAG